MIDEVAKDKNTIVIPLSNLNEEGIQTAKKTACEMLLKWRVERKSKKIGQHENDILNRITVAMPDRRDDTVGDPPSLFCYIRPVSELGMVVIRSVRLSFHRACWMPEIVRLEALLSHLDVLKRILSERMEGLVFTSRICVKSTCE